MKNNYFRIAYDQGLEAKENGQERTSPITHRLDEQFWYAGYDGIDFDQFDKFVKESRRSVKSSLGYSRIGLNNI